jgi:flagellar biosynthesis protein FlhB
MVRRINFDTIVEYFVFPIIVGFVGVAIFSALASIALQFTSWFLEDEQAALTAVVIIILIVILSWIVGLILVKILDYFFPRPTSTRNQSSTTEGEK